MQKRKAGDLLRWFRLEKNIAAKNLGYGICAASAVSNYESGKRELDTLLLEFF